MFAKLFTRIAKRLERVMYRRPDFAVGGWERPYLLRWWLVKRNKVANAYLHKFFRSDDDRAHHDHPWLFNITIMVKGRYLEHTIRKGGVHVVKEYKAGSVRFRWGGSPHRIEILPGETAVTVFLTGPIVRMWGFHCPKGWVPFYDFVSKGDAGSIGPGCGDKA